MKILKRASVTLALVGVFGPATLAAGFAAHGTGARGCAKTFSVAMVRRAADVAYRGVRVPSRADLARLRRYAACTRPAWDVPVGKAAVRRARAQNASRRAAAVLPAWQFATVSWYVDDGLSTASGWAAADGVADCGSGGGPCFPFGTRIEFSYAGRSVVAVVDDHGPYVAGRWFDLDEGTAAALGFSGVGVAGWRVVG